MDKRESPTVKSPVRKRPKQPLKPRKTYFFQPQNTLAYNPSAPARTSSTVAPHAPQEAPHAHIAGENAHLPPPEANVIVVDDSDDAGPASDAPQPVPKTMACNVSMEQQGSDDSFDGVRWKPLHSPRKFARPILSSPLKNGEPCLRDTAATVVNELTDSMLCKYGAGMENAISQTPRNPRTRSDGLKALRDASPTLMRSKSFDPRYSSSAGAQKLLDDASAASKLNTWIDMFEVDDKGNKLPKPEKVEDCDELSSDDDTFLANLKVDSFPPLLQVPQKAQTASKPSFVELVSLSDKLVDSDPFSDDLDIAAIESFALVSTSATTAPNTATSSFQKGEVVEVAKASKAALQEEDKLGAKISYKRLDFARYKITSVFPTTYSLQNRKRKQLIVGVIDGASAPAKLIVRGEAAELDLKEKDIVHVIHTSPENPRLIDDTHNLLIWHPDTLVSSTTVADQLYCPRKTVLSKRLSMPGESSIPLLVGTIVHEIFQLCFLSGKFTQEYLEEALEVETKRRLLEIYTLGDIVEDLKTKIRQHFPYIRKWFSSYYRRAPTEIPTNNRLQKIKFAVAEALDIEESVWSPMFGIKGIADVTLRATLEGDTSSGQFLLPMEIKTSQPYLSHQAQAALYSLLFKDRYNVDISSFLLVYTLNEGSTTKHDISTPDLKSLVNLRNRISVYLRSGNQELPDLMRQQKCDRCFVQQSCMTYNHLTEGGTSEISGLKEGLYDEITGHLVAKDKYAEFLSHWDGLLSREEEFVARFNKDLWVLTANEREEEQGKALANLVIAHHNDALEGDELLYTFKRASSSSDLPMTKTQIGKYDKVIISDTAGHFALALGFVRHIDDQSITIASRRRIIPTELKTDKFHRAGVLRASQAERKDTGKQVIFRLDKDEFFYGMGVARFNILNLLLALGDQARRKLIVDLEPPRFLSSNNFELDLSSNLFNEDQVLALEKVARTEDYSLILGMPGTGKTTVIALLIKMLVQSKKTVLLTSYTNSAVDNILLKVKELGVDFLRIGNASRMHPYIRDYVPGSDKKPVKSYDDYKEVFMKPYVVATTCLSIRDISFNVRDHFDYCIVDEASQVSMPLSLGPLAFADKFVLVGDHFQLPPLVTHPQQDIKEGLSVSLFQLLATAHPQSVVELKHQYRMCEDIMEISNALVYENRLLCGSEKVAQQSLAIPNKENLANHVNETLKAEKKKWLEHAFDEKNKVVFFNHDTCNGFERSVGENISNLTEVELVRQTVEAAVACGVDATKIGVMTLYRSQLKLLVESFRHMPQLEILTADRFQGRDKDCIIISMVRLNKEKRAGDLLKDWRRVNVAVTRARAKLIVFGSVSTLSQSESIKDFVALAKKKAWIYDLPSCAKHLYHFEPSSEASQSQKRSNNKIGSKIIGRHPLVRDILADMNVN